MLVGHVGFSIMNLLKCGVVVVDEAFEVVVVRGSAAAVVVIVVVVEGDGVLSLLPLFVDGDGVGSDVIHTQCRSKKRNFAFSFFVLPWDKGKNCQ